MFGLPIQNKNIAINASLTFSFDFFRLKENDHIRRKLSSKNVFWKEISICLKLGLVEPVQQKNLPSPNSRWMNDQSSPGFLMLKGKSLLDNNNLFSPKEYEINDKVIFSVDSKKVSMKKKTIDCNKYRKFKNPLIKH